MNRSCLPKLALFSGRKVIGSCPYPRIANPKMRLGYPVLLLILTPLWKQDPLKPLPLQVFYLIISEKALNIVSININILLYMGGEQGSPPMYRDNVRVCTSCNAPGNQSMHPLIRHVSLSIKCCWPRPMASSSWA